MSYLAGAGTLITDLFGAQNAQQTSSTGSATSTANQQSSATTANVSSSENYTSTLSNIIQSVLGHSTTTNDSTSSTVNNSQTVNTIDPETLALEKSLASGEIANANGTGAINADNVVSNIFTQAKNAFATTLGQGQNAGVYNDATRSVLGDATLAQATGDAATAVLGFKTNQQSMAAAILDSIAKTTGTATTTGGSTTTDAGTTTTDSSQTTNTMSNQIVDAITNLFSGSRTDTSTQQQNTQQTQTNSQTNGNSGGVSIVCTELMQQGKLSKRKWAISMRHFQQYREDGREAYYVWAAPVVAYLRKSPDSLLASVIQYFFSKRCDYIAGDRSTVGYICCALLWNLCAVTLYCYMKPRKFLAKFNLWRIA